MQFIFFAIRLISLSLILLSAFTFANPLADPLSESLSVRQSYNHPGDCGTNPPGPCDQNDCNAYNDPDGGLSVCRSGQYRGCLCQSTCGDTDGSCTDNGCEGFNDLNGKPGFCTAGSYLNCRCASICGPTSGSCADNGCDGKDGRCTAGDYKGCACDNP